MSPARTVVFTGPRGGMTAITVASYHRANPDDHLVLLVRQGSSYDAKADGQGLPPSSPTVHYLPFNMTSLSGVRSSSKLIASRVASGELPPIASIVCSAAIQVTSADQPRITEDGYEETVQVNHLAHSVLVLELLPAMAQDGRVVIVGSDSHMPDYKYFPKKAKYAPLREMLEVEKGSGGDKKEAQVIGWERYGNSKLLQIMWGNELARRLRKDPSYHHIKVVCQNPGSMGGTALFRDRPAFERVIFNTLFRWPFYHMLNYLEPGLNISLKEASAASLLNVIVKPEYADAQAKGQGGEQGSAPYYSPQGVLTETGGATNDLKACDELWRDTAQVLGYEGKAALQ